MVTHLKGKLFEKTSTYAVIDCNGIGYEVLIPVSVYEELPEENSDIFIYTHQVFREDSQLLFGFLNLGQKEAFKLLISVSGIGPKIAIGILSSVSFVELHDYIISKNYNALQKLPGIGKKSSERLALELQDKIIKLSKYFDTSESTTNNVAKSEALSALMALGYAKSIAEKSINQLLKEKGSEKYNVEDIIRKSLNIIMKR